MDELGVRVNTPTTDAWSLASAGAPQHQAVMKRGKIVQRLVRLGRLTAAGRVDVVADEIIGRLVPANPIFFWDKFLVIGTDGPRTRLGRAGPPPTLARPEEIERLCLQFPDKAARFRARVAEGQECWIFRSGDRIVARQWLIRDREAFLTNAGLRFAPPERPAIWAHDLYIDPAYRLRGYFVSLMQNALAPVAGLQPRVYSEVHFRNRASLGSCVRFGFEVVQEVSFWTVLGLRLYVARPRSGGRRLSWQYAVRPPRRL